MKNSFFLFKFAIAIMLWSCASPIKSQWNEIQKLFPDSAFATVHLVGYLNPQAGNSDPYLQNLPVLDTTFKRLLNVEYQADDPRAVFRYPLNKDGWWALVCLVGPGEASYGWRYILLPYDSSGARFGDVIELASHLGDCKEVCAESWMEDINSDGLKEITTKYVEFGIPNPDAEYCAEGTSPKWTTIQWQFDNGAFRQTEPPSNDSTRYTMEADKEVSQRFKAAGYSSWLPPHLR